MRQKLRVQLRRHPQARQGARLHLRHELRLVVEDKAGSARKHQNSSTAHLFFANPLKKSALSGLFSTHPPIEDRIRALQQG